jgi:putative membrane protein
MMWTAAPWWHWFGMASFWLLILLVAIWAISRLFPAGRPTQDARAILDERLARGELELAEYRRLREELTSTADRNATRE